MAMTDLPPDALRQALKEALVVTLYSTGKLSGREACEVLGMTHRAFQEMLPHYGFSILIDSPANVETELSA